MTTSTTALVIGGAACLTDDLLTGWLSIGCPDVVIGVNDALYTFRDIDAMATLHPEHVNKWRKLRDERGWPRVPVYSFHRPECGVTVWKAQDDPHEWWVGGSSGLYAVGVARFIYSADRIVLTGVPMDESPNRYREEDRWTQHERYWQKWEKAHRKGWLDGVTSLGGRTRALLGAPEAIQKRRAA